jgi:hypothetical protein
MNDHLRLHGEPEDDVTRGLRDLYRAPDGDDYWRGLEARILSHLTTAPARGWWDELDQLSRPAMVAAAVMIIAAGVALFRARQAEQDLAYEAMLTPTSLPIETAVRPVLQGKREGTFRYLMTR